MTQAAQLFHAPFTCSFAVRLAAAWGDVELDILPVRLGRCVTEHELAHEAVNPLRQVSTLILPSGSVLTETNACLIWVQSRSKNPNFHRSPESAQYFQMLRWIGFCATELHKQLLRIVFYDEATEAVKDKFRDLSASRLSFLNAHLDGKTVMIGETLSAADAYILWVLTLSGKAGVPLTPYANINAYFEIHQQDAHFRNLSEDDTDIKKSLK